MLAFIFRGVFLVGILSWYSTSVWKMIDVYFRNRFESYLRAEYDKNPHMLADLKAYRATAGKESPSAPIAGPEEHLEEVLQACSADGCPVTDYEDDLERGKAAAASKEATSEAPGANLAKVETAETTASIPIIVEKKDNRRVEANPEAISERLKNDSAKKGRRAKEKKTRRIAAAAAGRVERGKTTKNRLKTITFTKKDFASTRIGITSQDFAEFDLDEEAAQDEEDESASVLVSELPFKPKADIGDLKKVSPDEFCPVALEDEFSCEETKSWP